jgi:hypothetical protein
MEIVYSQRSSHTHWQAAQANAQTQAWQRVCLPHRTTKTTDKQANDEEHRTDNSTYKKLAVQWLNEVLCFVSSFVVAESFRLRNRQLLVAAKRYHQVNKLKILSK